MEVAQAILIGCLGVLGVLLLGVYAVGLFRMMR
jgi:hypothetical protein